MTSHTDVAALDLVDRYITGQLTADEAAGFEEHFFACDECFADVQAAEQLRSAVHEEAAAGARQPQRATWSPAFAFATATAAMLAIATLWLALATVPGLQRELSTERQARVNDTARKDLQQEQVRVAIAAEPNVPIAIIQNTRAGGVTFTIDVPDTASHVVLWIEAPASARAETFRLVIDATTIEGLRANAEGALAVAVPAAALPPGPHVARLYAAASPAVLAGEYHLIVVRPR
jgi:hypothetical protein